MSSDSRGGWRDATALITQYILAGRETNEVLGEITSVVQALSGADYVTVSFADSEGQNVVEVESARTGASLLGQPTPTGPDVIAAALGHDEGHEMTLTVVSPYAAVGPGVAATDVTDQFNWFTDQVRIAIELGATRRRAEQLLILEDRDRIARDLHDVVIQRLFGAGMQLESVQRSLVDQPAASIKIDTVLSELDTTIKDIRSTIFALRSSRLGEAHTLSQKVRDLAAELTATLGIHVDYTFKGLEQQEVGEQLTQDVLAVIREATTNVAKHSEAKTAQVGVWVNEEEIVLTVVNEGTIDTPLAGASCAELEASGHSGFCNMLRRAARYSGTSRLADIGGDPPKTRLTWNASMLVVVD